MIKEYGEKRQDKKYHAQQVYVLSFGWGEITVENVKAHVGIRHQTVGKACQQQNRIEMPLKFLKPYLALTQGISQNDLNHDIDHQNGIQPAGRRSQAVYE
jgi:hypothetical protein